MLRPATLIAIVLAFWVSLSGQVGDNNAVYGRFATQLLSCQQSTSDTLSAATITTNETAFGTTYTIPANLLVANKFLRVMAGFSLTSSGSPPTTTIRLRAGGLAGTVIYASVAQAAQANLTSIGGGAEWLIAGTGAAGASVNTITHAMATAAFINSSGGMGNRTAQPVAIATNANQSLVVTLQYSAGTSGNTLTLQQLCVESIG